MAGYFSPGAPNSNTVLNMLPGRMTRSLFTTERPALEESLLKWAILASYLLLLFAMASIQKSINAS